MIRLQDVHLSLRSDAGMVDILRGCELVVVAGESVGLVGPSGSGKSTLLAIIAGLERPTSGSVSVAQHRLEALSEDDLARFRRDNVGIVFQSFHLIPTMSALENVALPLELAGRRDAWARAGEGLAAVGLEHRLQHYPGQLSGGEQQRVALARALACRPKLLLADEPTGNLDGHTGRQVVDLMFASQRSSGATLLLVTHDLALARRCDRLIAMADGRVLVPLAGAEAAGAGSRAAES